MKNILVEIFENYQKCPYDFPFDLASEPNKYGYFEALIGKDGKVYEAPNGHQRGLVMMIARNKGITPEQVDAEADVMYYIEYLLKESGAVMIWHDYYIAGNDGLNDAQIATIELLKEKGYMNKKATPRTYGY